MTTLASVPAYLIAYDMISFASALILALMILTAICSKQVYRGKGWFGMMSCWLLYSLSYGLLVGKQLGPEPVFGHCFVQTMLIYAAPPLVAVGTLSFYLDFYLGSCWDPARRRSLRTGVAYFVLALPWIVHLAIDIEVIILTVTSSSNPKVQRIGSNLYCHLSNTTTPGLVNAAIVVLAMVLLIPIEVWTGIQLYRSRSIRAGEDFRQYLSVYLRIAACTIVAATAFGLSAITLVDAKPDSKVQDLSFPCLSMAVSLIFATQQDLLNAWLGRPSRYFFPNSSVISSINHQQPEQLKDSPNNRTFQSESSGYS